MLTPILIPHIEVNSGPARARLIRNGEWARGQRKVSQAEEKGRRSGLNIESNAVSMSWRLHVALCDIPLPGSWSTSLPKLSEAIVKDEEMEGVVKDEETEDGAIEGR
ncbi:hypothetical protein FOXYS1_6898 [Fusarium oxysporum]|uniref:Uncharacterized protein n=1 Tax=Fusarium oxysporum TaxID=5507 RepID=A0A8H5ADC1_FUSOX|nr:hypothetical protein FOXYS1_6898 [Fusarium oxysporum]